MKKFINELKYLNRDMPNSTKVIIGIMISYFIFTFGRNIIYNPLIFINIIILLISLLIHELSHGFVAYLCGDNTAKRYGRLSLNPLNHLDPLGTIFPILLILSGAHFVFGWAKPVPINYYRLKYGRVGEFLVAIAGIASNILLATLGIFILKYMYESLVSWHLVGVVLYLINLNILLAIFNIMPIPPLDGSRIVAAIGNENLRETIFHMDRYGILIIMILSWTGMLYRFIIPTYEFMIEFLYKII